MSETLSSILSWGLIALGFAPIMLAIGGEFVEGSVLPRLIPRAEIERLAEDLTRRCPADPEQAALIEEHAAWFRSETYEQGKWRRVRKLIRHRII